MPRAPKRCGRPDCEELVVARTYCPTHTAETQQRANTTARGYGARHQSASRAAKARMPEGTPCVRCGEPMYRSQRLALDHDDQDRTQYLGLSHFRCNSRAGALNKRTA